MRVLAFPIRIESGAFSTVEQGSLRDAQQLAVGIVSTRIRERPLAPDFGTFDQIGVGVSEAEIVAAVALCEPDLSVVNVAISRDGDRQDVAVTVAWDEETTDGV